MALDGILFELFSWLPAEAIFKFTSVCKACYEFASELLFAKKQQANMDVDTGFFIQPNWFQNYRNRLEFHQLEPCSGFPNQSLELLQTTGSVVLASSRGLVCFRTKSNIDPRLILFNPATRAWDSIPIPDSMKNNYSNRELHILFRCNIIEDFLLMVMEESEEWGENSLGCKIYSAKQRAWEERESIKIGPRNMIYESIVYSSGCVYFLSDWYPYLIRHNNNSFYWPYVVAYDLQNGTSKFIKLPKGIRKGLNHLSCMIGIFELGKGKGKTICLVKFTKGVFTIWVLLSDYHSSWTRILKARARAMGIMIEKITYNHLIIAGFTIINGDSLLVATKEKVYRYGLTWRDERRPSSSLSTSAKEICRHDCGDQVLFFLYSNTLRSCKAGDIPL